MSSGTPVRNAARITGIAPQLLADDVDRAVAYYPPDSASSSISRMSRSTRVSVVTDSRYISSTAARSAGDKAYRKENGHLDAYIAVSGVRGLFDELRARGADVTRPLEERPWSCVDFCVEDVDGNILCSVSRTPEHSKVRLFGGVCARARTSRAVGLRPRELCRRPRFFGASLFVESLGVVATRSWTEFDSCSRASPIPLINSFTRPSTSSSRRRTDPA